jgi:hypothetical protein
MEGEVRKGLLQSERLASVIVSALFGLASLAITNVAFAAGPCTGPGAPTNSQTKCLSAVQISGKPLGEIDVSWVDPDRAE